MSVMSVLSPCKTCVQWARARARARVKARVRARVRLAIASALRKSAVDGAQRVLCRIRPVFVPMIGRARRTAVREPYWHRLLSLYLYYLVSPCQNKAHTAHTQAHTLTHTNAPSRTAGTYKYFI